MFSDIKVEIGKENKDELTALLEESDSFVETIQQVSSKLVGVESLDKDELIARFEDIKNDLEAIDSKYGLDFKDIGLENLSELPVAVGAQVGLEENEENIVKRFWKWLVKTAKKIYQFIASKVKKLLGKDLETMSDKDLQKVVDALEAAKEKGALYICGGNAVETADDCKGIGELTRLVETGINMLQLRAIDFSDIQASEDVAKSLDKISEHIKNVLTMDPEFEGLTENAFFNNMTTIESMFNKDVIKEFNKRNAAESSNLLFVPFGFVPTMFEHTAMGSYKFVAFTPKEKRNLKVTKRTRPVTIEEYIEVTKLLPTWTGSLVTIMKYLRELIKQNEERFDRLAKDKNHTHLQGLMEQANLKYSESLSLAIRMAVDYTEKVYTHIRDVGASLEKAAKE